MNIQVEEKYQKGLMKLNSLKHGLLFIIPGDKETVYQKVISRVIASDELAVNLVSGILVDFSEKNLTVQIVEPLATILVVQI